MGVNGRVWVCMGVYGRVWACSRMKLDRVRIRFTEFGNSQECVKTQIAGLTALDVRDITRHTSRVTPHSSLLGVLDADRRSAHRAQRGMVRHQLRPYQMRFQCHLDER